MAAYYNEIDEEAAAWLRKLIAARHIADGEVDTRSIEDVRPSDIRGFTQCHFFAGIGVWSYALRLAGWPDDRPVWTGSCPCQPFSAAGNGTGFNDSRHLWPAFNWLIQQCRPPIIFGEQVGGKAGENWLDHVQTDLEAQDYACGAATFPACSVGAPHIRQRMYWLAYSSGKRLERYAGHGDNIYQQGRHNTEPSRSIAQDGTFSDRQPLNGFWSGADWVKCRDKKWRHVEPGIEPLVNGAAARMGRLRGYGNAIVAPQARTFIECAMEAIR